VQREKLQQKREPQPRRPALFRDQIPLAARHRPVLNQLVQLERHPIKHTWWPKANFRQIDAYLTSTNTLVCGWSRRAADVVRPARSLYRVLIEIERPHKAWFYGDRAEI
jgi:hypothetical protein